MAKPRNPVESEKIIITTTPQVRLYLAALVAGGLYGKNTNEAAERLLAGAIQDRLRDGTLTRIIPSSEWRNSERGKQTIDDPRRS